MPLNNAEKVLTSKHLKAAAPLDRKGIAILLAERDDIDTGDRYHMMKVAVQEDSKEYILNDAGNLTNTGWKEIGNYWSQGGYVITEDFIITGNGDFGAVLTKTDGNTGAVLFELNPDPSDLNFAMQATIVETGQLGSILYTAATDTLLIHLTDGTDIAGLLITPTTIGYNADISATYTDRSFIDKAYADANYNGGGGGWATSGDTNIDATTKIILPSATDSIKLFEWEGDGNNDLYGIEFRTSHDNILFLDGPRITFGRKSVDFPPFGQVLVLEYTEQPTTSLAWGDLSIPTKKYVDDNGGAGAGKGLTLNGNVLDLGDTTLDGSITFTPTTAGVYNFVYGSASKYLNRVSYDLDEIFLINLDPANTAGAGTSLFRLTTGFGGSSNSLFTIENDAIANVKLDSNGFVLVANADNYNLFSFRPDIFKTYISNGNATVNAELILSATEVVLAAIGVPLIFKSGGINALVFDYISSENRATFTNTKVYLDAPTTAAPINIGGTTVHPTLNVTVGDFYYNTTDKTFYGRTDTAWLDLGGSGWAITGNTNVTAPVIDFGTSIENVNHKIFQATIGGTANVSLFMARTDSARILTDHYSDIFLGANNGNPAAVNTGGNVGIGSGNLTSILPAGTWDGTWKTTWQGDRNIAIGSGNGAALVGSAYDKATSNTLIGQFVMPDATDASYNQFIGFYTARYFNVPLNGDDGQFNVGLGSYALYTAITSGKAAYNTAIGPNTMWNTPKLSRDNTAIGDNAMGETDFVVSTPSTDGFNTAVGASSLKNAVLLLRGNTGVGTSSGRYGGGSDNTYIGRSSGWSMRGTGNTSLGYQAAHNPTNTYGGSANTIYTGSNSTFVGYRAGYATASAAISNVIVIGNNYQPVLVAGNTYIQAANDIIIAPTSELKYASTPTITDDLQIITKGYADATYSGGSGDVTAGTQANTQIAYWNATTKQIEGSSNFVFNGTSVELGILPSGTRSFMGQGTFFLYNSTNQAIVSFGQTSSHGLFQLKDSTGNVKIQINGGDANAPVTLYDTASIRISQGTDAQRPAVPGVGMIRWNSTGSNYEGYNGSGWDNFSGGGGGSPAGTVEGAIQLRNAAGDDFAANDGVKFTGTTLSVLPDTDSASILGRLRMGFHTTPDKIYLAHYDQWSENNYMISQTNLGFTVINAPTNTSVVLAINNLAYFTLNFEGNSVIRDGNVINLGTNAGIPTNLVGDGDMYYDSDLSKMRVFENSAWTDMIGGGSSATEERIMFDSNLDTVREVYYNGTLTFGSFNIDTVLTATLEFETSTDGTTWTSHGTIAASGTPPTALNTWIGTNGSGNWYLRLTVVYQSEKTEASGSQWTFTR